MSEPIKENETPLSQEAKAALKRVNEYPDPYYLYLLQLMFWAVELNQAEFQVPSRVKEALGVLLAAKPEKAYRTLIDQERDSDQENTMLAELLSRKESPLEQAKFLLENLQSQMNGG